MKKTLTRDENIKKNLMKTVIQFIKFGIIGASNTVISLAFYYLFLWVNPDLFIVGYTVGFVASVLNAYFLNHKFVFSKKEKGHLKPLIKTFVVYGITFVFGLVFLWIMVDGVGISEKIAPLVNLMFTVPLNFAMIKLWAFGEKTDKSNDKTEMR